MSTRPVVPAVVRRHLEHGVDGLDLHAGDRVERGGAAEPLERGAVAVRAAVPIRDRRRDQLTPGVEQAVVDAPGVHADRRHRPGLQRGGEPLLGLGHEPCPVPPEHTRPVVRWRVRVAVDQRQPR
jgi:hypothetical protein